MSAPEGFFRALRTKARSGILIEGIAFLAAVFVVFMLVSFVLDRTLRLEFGFRLALLVILLGGLGWFAWRRLMQPMSVDLNDEELALAVERSDSGLRQTLISAVQFERDLEKESKGIESRAMKELVVRQTKERMASLRGKDALDGKRVFRFVGLVIVCLVVVGVWFVRDSDSLSLWAKRNLFLSSEEWPRYTKLRFVMEVDEEGRVRQAENDELTVEVRAGGEIPEQVSLHYHFHKTDQDGWQAMDMSGDVEDGEQRFRTTLPPFLEPATLYATGADGLTKELEIILIKRPRTKELSIKLEYPAYMKRKLSEVADSEGELQMPIGGTLVFAGKTTKKLRPERGAFVTFGKDQKQLLKVGDDRLSFTGRYQPKDSGTLTINVEDRDGLGVDKPTKLFLRLMPDREPNVDFTAKGIGSMITRIARIPGELKVRDDYGLTAVAANFRISGGKDRNAIDPKAARWEIANVEGMPEFKAEDGETLLKNGVRFDLLTVNDLDPTNDKNRVFTGQLLALRFHAQDNFGPGEPHRGESEVLTFRVVTQAKLVEDLHRRQAEQRRETQEIHKRVRNARLEIAEILNPTSEDPRAVQARRRLLALSRQQRNLRSRIGSVLSAYAQIINEYDNNRILKPNLIIQLHRDILVPLADLYKDDFPASAKLVEDFASSGQEDVRQAALASYDAILAVLKRLIDKMRRLESIAAILEQLKDVRKAEAEIQKLVQQLLDKDGGGKDVEKSKEPPKKPEEGK